MQWLTYTRFEENTHHSVNNCIENLYPTLYPYFKSSLRSAGAKMAGLDWVMYALDN